MSMADRSEDHGAERSAWLRWLPVAAILTGAAVALWLNGDLLSFEALARHHDALVEWRDANWAWAALVFFAAYVAVVAFSVPGAVWMTIGAGFLFGTTWGTALTVLAATLGAALVFLAARSSLGQLLHRKAGPWLARVEGEFARGEISFLLVLRLVPLVPFFVANLLPAFLNARFGNFLWTTLVGIAPATLVFASVGAGLWAELAEGQAPDPGVLLETHILVPLLGLAALAALPVALRHFRGR